MTPRAGVKTTLASETRLPRLPDPNRGPHFFAIPVSRTYFFNQIISLTRSDVVSFFAIRGILLL